MNNDFSMMMALGPFYFALDTAAYQKLTHEMSWRYAKVDRLGREPATHYMGPGAQKVSLSGTIYPHFRGGLGQIDKMREAADLGPGLLMVDGDGNVLGDWCIESISADKSVFFANGMPRRIDFRMSLTSYGDDKP